jgi:hypothetical protein
MKRFLLIGALILQNFAAFGQSANLEVYDGLYNESPTWLDKLSVLRGITAANIDGAVDFYAKSFSDLVLAYRGIKQGGTEWVGANSIARILIAELVSARYEAAGDNFWRCYQFFTDPNVQAQALIALGELKIESHYADVEQMVQWLNANPSTTTANRQKDEVIAIGGFTALEKYGKPEGYLAAFIGSESWYRDLVKKAARSAVTTLLQDPSRLLPDVIMVAQYSPALKQKALAYVDGAALDNTQKAEIASQTLLQGWRTRSNDESVIRELAGLRRAALQVIRKYGSNGTPETYAAVRRSLREGAYDEKHDSILALGAINTTESAAILVDYAQHLNENRYMANSESIDDRLMRSIVPVLGTLSDSRARDMLQQIQTTPWSNTVINMARETLSKLG